MAAMLEKVARCIKVPAAISDSANTYWLFPIQVNNPEIVSRELRKQGFDVPRGLSQLECIAKYSSNGDCCHRADELMSCILYLPVASRALSSGNMCRLTVALNFATTTVYDPASVSEPESLCSTCRSIRGIRSCFVRSNAFLILVIAAFIIDATAFHCIPLSRLLFASATVALNLSVSILSLFIVFAVIMRWTMADFYLQSSKCFAKYNSMLFSKPYETGDEVASMSSTCGADEYPGPLLNMELLRLSLPRNEDESPEDGFVLLTGATGFIGRLLLRDLLLYRKSLVIPGGVVVLCRSKRGKSACDRITKLLDDPMFSFLSDTEKQNLVRVVEGDVTRRNIGLEGEDMDEICNDLRITHVIHCAASVSFTQTLKDAAISNITSSLNLQSFDRPSEV